MKKNFVSKKKLVLTIIFCGILIATSMLNVIAVKPENPGEPIIPIDLWDTIPDGVSADGDWNIWEYEGHMLSIPEGNIGIGFGENPWIPREKLEVFGNILLTPATDQNIRSIGVATRDFFGASLLLYGGFGEFSPGNVIIRGGNSLYGMGDVILADKGGDVGIGIDQPEAKLDVDGDVRVRESLEVTDSILTDYLGATYFIQTDNVYARDIWTSRVFTNITTIEGPYFICSGEHTIIAKTSLDTYGVYLPRCSEANKGWMLIIKQVGSMAGVTVYAFENDHIEGADSIYLEGGESITIQSDGDDWWILSSYP